MQQQTIQERPTCPRGPTHKNMPILMICLQKNCTRKRLCCLSCIDELHTKHELMSLKKFYSYIEEIVNHNLLFKDKEEMINAIEKSRSGIHDGLEKIRDNFNKKIDDLQAMLNQHFKSIRESYQQEQLVNVYQHIRSEFTDEKIQQFYQTIKKAEGNLSRPLAQIKKIITQTETSLTQKLTLYLKQIQKHNESIKNQILQFKISKNTLTKITFNEATKSAFLSISEQGKVAKRTQGSGAYPIAVVNHQFTPDQHTVGFKIVEQLGNKGIWMGVCVLDVVKNLNFQSCYGIGKGTWGIDQVGEHHASAYSWSHHDTNYNSAPKVGWQFWTGDLVEITVDFEKSVARFTKNKQFHYEQPIKLDIGPLYAFAGPTHLNDSISIA